MHFTYCTTERAKQIINFDEIDGHSLQLLYNEFYKKNKKEKREMHGYPTHEIPEGICGIFGGDKETDRKFRDATANTIIICPSTLVLLGMSALKDYRDIVGIVFNEGLKHIDDEACSGCFNLGKVESTIFPSTLKKIGIKAFYDCPNMLVPILNEGLEDIGTKAFWYSKQGYKDNFITASRSINFPSTVVKAGEDIVNIDEIPYRIVFKNYKGQKIPDGILGLLYKKKNSLYVKNKNTGSIGFYKGGYYLFDVELQQDAFESYIEVNEAIKNAYMQARAIRQEPEDQMH